MRKEYRFWITKESFIQMDFKTYEKLNEFKVNEDTLCKVIPVSEKAKAPSEYWIFAPVDKFEEIEVKDDN